MSPRCRLLIGAVVVLAVIAAFVVHLGERQPAGEVRSETAAPPVAATSPPDEAGGAAISGIDPAIAAEPGRAKPLPRLVDLGSDRCIPCKQMEPILASLAEDYASRLDVEVIDVRKQPAAARTWRIRVIPTQILIDEAGRELARHEGFWGREDILAAWRELGYTFDDPGKAGR